MRVQCVFTPSNRYYPPRCRASCLSSPGGERFSPSKIRRILGYVVVSARATRGAEKAEKRRAPIGARKKNLGVAPQAPGKFGVLYREIRRDCGLINTMSLIMRMYIIINFTVYVNMVGEYDYANVTERYGENKWPKKVGPLFSHIIWPPWTHLPNLVRVSFYT
jgi:hypothetical protein